jgi:plasmid stabilization system protein ParE
MTFFFHRAAEKDLTDALRFYKAEAGKGVAGKFLKEFERVVAVLEEFPGIGTPQGGERLSFRGCQDFCVRGG